MSCYVEYRFQVIDGKGSGLAERHIIFRVNVAVPNDEATRVAFSLSQRAQPLERCKVLLPGRYIREGRSIGDLLKDFSNADTGGRPEVDLEILCAVNQG